ncbi:hypothetical protein NC981_25115 [Leptolyngbya sp. DQ-M1]|uniref:hypothetical protein n=1 Tax=Leptolyngbya sp. DQ-M1 TaxID=2933920 RepID=UPI003296C17D
MPAQNKANKSNKFSFLQDIPEDRNVTGVEAAAPDVVKAVASPVPDDGAYDRAGEGAAVAVPQPAAKKVGRPKGKRSDPDYEQVTAYIRKDTHRDIKIALLQEGQGREFSELVQELLDGFLSTQKSG